MAGASPYPISQLIARIISESGLKRSGFIVSIGYRSIEGGLRKLDEFLKEGRGDGGFLQRVVDVYDPDPVELERAIAETDQIRNREHDERIRHAEERARRRFQPFMWVHTVERAHSVLSAMAEKQVKVLSIADGFLGLPESDQLATVQRRVREHYQNSGGKYNGFGNILRYQFANSFDTSIVLNNDGGVLETNSGRFLLPEVSFQLR